MLKSMTGYGLAVAEFNNMKISVELRSLNSKFLELFVKLPKSYGEKETQLRNECSKQVERGKVNLAISIDKLKSDEQQITSLNQELFKSYYQQLKKLADELGNSDTDIFRHTLSIQEIWNVQQEGVNEEEWKVVSATFQKAMDAFNSFRLEEGNTLAKDLEYRIGLILDAIPEVEKYESSRIPAIKEKLEILIKEAVGIENIDRNRLEQELVYFVEKFDITEEKIRLKSHCDYFLSVMKEKESNGKKLGFISQEIGREINTMGSKSNDATMQKIVVRMKDELEKIKEQLLNIL